MDADGMSGSSTISRYWLITPTGGTAAILLCLQQLLVHSPALKEAFHLSLFLRFMQLYNGPVRFVLTPHTIHLPDSRCKLTVYTDVPMPIAHANIDNIATDATPAVCTARVVRPRDAAIVASKGLLHCYTKPDCTGCTAVSSLTPGLT